MAGLLDEPYPRDALRNPIPDPAKTARMHRLHRQTWVALQVMLANRPIAR